MAIRLVHLYTGPDGQSHFTQRTIDLRQADTSSQTSAIESARNVSFEETAPRSSLDWHNAPQRQYVITLAGTLEFETRLGERFTIATGDVLLAEDTTGGGHRWRLVDDQPWRRVYVGL